MKLGINDNWITYYQQSGRFADLLTSGSPFGVRDATGKVVYAPSDRLPVGASATTGTEGYVRPGLYTLAATGIGTLKVAFTATNKPTFGTGPGALSPTGIATFTGKETYTVTLNGPGFIYLTATASDATKPLGNVSFRLANAGAGLYDPAFLAALKGVDTIRFMDPPNTDGSQRSTWADANHRPGFDEASWIDLCNELNCNGYFHVPARAVGPNGRPTDYAYEMGALIGTRLNPNLKAYVAWSNEVWNWSPPYADQTWYIYNQVGYEPTVGGRQNYAKGAHAVHAAVASQVDPANGPQLVRVLEAQLGAPETISISLPWALARGYKFDCIAGGYYWGMFGDRTAIRTAWTAGDRATTFMLIDDGFRAGIAKILPWHAAFQAIAGKYNIPLVGYEGGPSTDMWNNATDKPIISAYTDDPLCEKQHMDAFTAFDQAGLTLLNYYSFCHDNPIWSTIRNGDDRTNRRSYAVKRWTTGGAPIWPEARDATTQGAWSGVYGRTAAIVPAPRPGGGKAPLPTQPMAAGVSVTCTQSFTWAASTTDIRAPQIPAATTPGIATDSNTPLTTAAVCFNDPKEIDIDVPGTGLQVLSLYFMDWQKARGPLAVRVLDGESGALIDTQSVAQFGGGIYLRWTISGHVKVLITPAGSPDVVLSGIFLD